MCGVLPMHELQYLESIFTQDEINRTEASTLATDERTTVESSPVLEPITSFVRHVDPTRETDTPNLACRDAEP
jgi:hypothetical protein